MSSQYSSEAVHKVFDKLMELVCEQSEEIEALQGSRRPTPHFDAVKADLKLSEQRLDALATQVNRLLELANGGYVTADDIFAIFGGRNVP